MTLTPTPTLKRLRHRVNTDVAPHHAWNADPEVAVACSGIQIIHKCIGIPSDVGARKIIINIYKKKHLFLS